VTFEAEPVGQLASLIPSLIAQVSPQRRPWAIVSIINLNHRGVISLTTKLLLAIYQFARRHNSLANPKIASRTLSVSSPGPRTKDYSVPGHWICQTNHQQQAIPIVTAHTTILKHAINRLAILKG
jgi:hypothetical protein